MLSQKMYLLLLLLSPATEQQLPLNILIKKSPKIISYDSPFHA